MDEALSGTGDTSLITVLLIVVVIVLGIAALLWFMRRRNHVTFVRGSSSRKPRLAVLDATAVDAHRRLVLVRRDNVEHLILIGGPSDLVVESGIDRAAAKARRQQPEQNRSAAQPSSASAPVNETETIRKPLPTKPESSAVSELKRDIERQSKATKAKAEDRPIPSSRNRKVSEETEPVDAVEMPPIDDILEDRQPEPEVTFAKASRRPAVSPDAVISEIENMLDAAQEPPEPAAPVTPAAPRSSDETPAARQKRPPTAAHLSVSIDPVPAPAPPPEIPPASPEELLADFDRALEVDYEDIGVAPAASSDSGNKDPKGCGKQEGAPDDGDRRSKP